MAESTVAKPDAQETQDQKRSSDINFRSLVQNSENFQSLKNELVVAVRLSLTGITNLVVKHEDPCLVDAFIKECFKMEELYNNTIDIDAIELQQGQPGRGFSVKYIDELIYGSLETTDGTENDAGIPVVQTDAQTGKRKRKSDGFVSRKEVIRGWFKDKLLIIKNIDYALDFCKETAGEVDPRALWVLDNFRNPTVKKGCRLLLVTNKKLIIPFKIRTVEFNAVSTFEANHVVDSFINLYKNGHYAIDFTTSQREQIVRKISGLTYTEAGDSLAYAISQSESPKGSKKISSTLALKVLREKINRGFMDDGFGLTHLTPRPWEDYICPESSNFTFDVAKILRDFREIDRLKKVAEDNISNGIDESSVVETMEAIQIRIPHIIVLYGPGGVGKSAFPIHLAGLLDFDVWDFNINATHSKWIGEGSKQMRESLKKISSSSHLIIRVDEYDRAIGASGESGQGMHEAHKQVESEFMNWLQNSQEENLFVKNHILLVLTTNHKENITGPLLRSGRSDLVIDINNFDAKSMKETFITSARRMKNRGTKVIGFRDDKALQEAINKLNIDHLSELATLKGFTVRDVETLLMEMAAHRYYHKLTNGKDGLEWTNENFAEVLEHSEGTVKDDATGELVLGDRHIFQQRIRKEKGVSENKDDKQGELFKDDGKNIYDPSKMKDIKGFQEK